LSLRHVLEDDDLSRKVLEDQVVKLTKAEPLLSQLGEEEKGEKRREQ
jgi:hypothetical protein